MKSRHAAWIALFLAVTATIMSPAYAQSSPVTQLVAFVNATSLLCRAEPAPAGAVVTRLGNRQQVTILERRAEWTRVSPTPALRCWVMEQYLTAASSAVATSGVRSSVGRHPIGSPSTAPMSLASPRPARATIERALRPRRVSAGGACPCSSSRNCTGPRGGRYCTTSGGAKRYR